MIMKRILIFALILAAAAGCTCGEKAPAPALMDGSKFDTVLAGKKVGLYTLQNGDVTVQVTNFGARVVSLYTQDKDGRRLFHYPPSLGRPGKMDKVIVVPDER